MTHEEANAILNRFVGWESKQLMRLPLRSRDDIPEIHEKDDWCAKAGCCPVSGWPPFDYFADTPEARERVRLLKDEFVRRTGDEVVTHSYLDAGDLLMHDTRLTNADVHLNNRIESHAIALAIAAALKEKP